MSKRAKAFFSMGVVSVFQILLNIVRNKLTAVILGTYGIGIMAVLANLIGIVQPISNLAINNGVIKKISDDQEDKQTIKNVINTSYITTLSLSVIMMIVMIVFSKKISLYNLNNKDYYKYIIIISLTVPLTAFSSIGTSIINGFKRVNLIARISIISSMFNIIVSVVLIYLYKIDGAVYSLLVMSIFGYIINFTVVKLILQSNDIYVKLSYKNYNFNVLKGLAGFGTTALFALLFANTSMLIIRTAITKIIGMDYNGIFQADWSIMNQYIGILFSSCAVYYFPTLCSLKSSEDKIHEMNKTLEMLLFIVVPLFMGIFCFKDIVISVLYDKKFMIASDLLSVFIIGDFFKVIAWTIGTVFSAINKLKEFIIIDFFASMFFVIMSVVLLHASKSLYGIAWTYVMLNILLVAVYYIYLKKNMNFRFLKGTRKNIITSFLALVICYVVVMFININFVFNIAASVVVFLVWFKIVVSHDDLENIKRIVKNKISKKLHR